LTSTTTIFNDFTAAANFRALAKDLLPTSFTLELEEIRVLRLIN
jgi:hypothetical protein